jgi:hypothetical protein
VSQRTEWMKQTCKKVTRTEGVLWTHISSFGEMDLYPIFNGRELRLLKFNNYFDLVTWKIVYIIPFKTQLKEANCTISTIFDLSAELLKIKHESWPSYVGIANSTHFLTFCWPCISV